MKTKNPAAAAFGEQILPIPPLRLARPDDEGERKRAALYRSLMQQGAERDLPVVGDLAFSTMEPMPPLHRERMVPERVGTISLCSGWAKILRGVFRLLAPMAPGERG